MSACILCNNSPCQCQELIHGRCNDEIADLRTRLQTAEQTIRYCNDLLAPVIGDLAAPLEHLCRSAARSIQESDQQLGQVREEKDGLILDCERLATDLEQACRQWKMYAEEREDEDLEKESHVEAVSYRASVKTAKNWRDKAFTLMHPNLSPAAPSDGCGKGRTDKERMDWLEANKCAFPCTSDSTDFAIILPESRGSGELAPLFNRSIREAIDGAIVAASSKGKEGGV